MSLVQESALPASVAGPAAWEGLPAAQQPHWRYHPDYLRAREELALAPPLVSMAELDALQTALEHYQSCAASRDVTRVTKRLDGLGARRGPVRKTSASRPWDTLTDSELRVVRLVAQGLTNRETASRLFLSPHTVDSHLRHSFTKLGVNSRVELTRQVLAHDRDVD